VSLLFTTKLQYVKRVVTIKKNIFYNNKLPRKPPDFLQFRVNRTAIFRNFNYKRFKFIYTYKYFFLINELRSKFIQKLRVKNF